MTVCLLYIYFFHVDMGKKIFMEEDWLNLMFYKKTLEYQGALSKSMNSLSPIENTGGSEEPIGNHIDKNTFSGVIVTILITIMLII